MPLMRPQDEKMRKMIIVRGLIHFIDTDCVSHEPYRTEGYFGRSETDFGQLVW